jgi:peptide/nickel transport system permease protein
MVDWVLLRERYRAYRRSFSNTWALFKESKIGVAGVAIMSAFVILAVLAPVLPLRDPIFWRAPSTDVINLPTYWEANTSTAFFGAGAPIESQIAIRVLPNFADPAADRIYAASGSRLVAVNPSTGTAGWDPPGFDASSRITAGPVGVNYGSKQDPLKFDYVVYIGAEDGSFYALSDSDTHPLGVTGRPGGSRLVVRTLVGEVTSIAVWSNQSTASAALPPFRTAEERVFVGTSAGNLYAFAASNLSLLWEQNLGSAAVRMTEYPLLPSSNPSYSPALADDGERLYVNAGNWFALYAENGSFAWPQFFEVSTPWTSSPVVARPSNLADGTFGDLVFAASDDGWLFARRALTGEPYGIWADSPAAQLHPGGEFTIPVLETAAERDPGPLLAPWIEGGTVYVSSGSGTLYAIARDPIGDLAAGTVRWRFSDRILQEQGFHFSARPIVHPLQPLIYVPGINPKGTPDVSDDSAVLYSLEVDGRLFWRRDFDAPLRASASIWKTPSAAQLHPSVWVGTGDGMVVSIASTGEYLAPLPPGSYPSGNTYLWGTDDQGRDILSQFIWGSRIALIVGFAAAGLSVGIGLVVGLVAGYVGRKTEVVLMRFTDVILVLPTLPLLIILSAVLGASIGNVILVIALLAWPGTARVIRSDILSLKERPYIHSARVTGASNARIMFRHLAPNVMPLVFLYMTFAVSGAILFEAALSFLGLGDINTPSWGTMLSTIQQSDIIRAYWWLLPPGLGITLLSLAFFLVGRAFEQIINPRLRLR